MHTESEIEEFTHNFLDNLNIYLQGQSIATLPSSEIRSLFNSITSRSFQWKTFKDLSSNRGVLRKLKVISVSMSLSEKQSLGAKFVHRSRKNKTRLKILKNIHDCKLHGLKITKKLISKMSGINYKHLIKHYKDLF